MFCINDKEGTRGPTKIFEPGPPVTLLRYCMRIKPITLPAFPWAEDGSMRASSMRVLISEHSVVLYFFIYKVPLTVGTT